MPESTYQSLSSREREIMETVFRCGRATVAEIRSGMRAAPTSAAVRTMLSRLEDKGLLSHSQDGPRNVYTARTPVSKARQSALRRLMQTFFEGSPTKTVATILEESSGDLDEEDLDQLAELIERARARGA